MVEQNPQLGYAVGAGRAYKGRAQRLRDAGPYVP
jgi:hypothetical protein